LTHPKPVAHRNEDPIWRVEAGLLESVTHAKPRPAAADHKDLGHHEVLATSTTLRVLREKETVAIGEEKRTWTVLP
jgi:hypothetical protein